MDGLDVPGMASRMGQLTRVLDICVTGDASSPHESERAQALARLGHRVRVVSPVPASIDGLTVTVPWGWSIRARIVRRLVLMLTTLWAVWREKADVVHCHYAAEYTTWAAALLGKRNLVVTVMGGDVLFDEQGRQGAIGRALTRFALRRAVLITVKAPRLGRVVEGMGVDPCRIMEVLWGIDLEAFHADPDKARDWRERWGVASGDLVFFSPRPLKPFYNQPLMISALSQVRERHGNAKLVMTTYAEDDGYRDALMAQASELGVADALEFVPPCAHADMAHLYGASDVVLSIPPSDGFPQTLVEAAATGRPCVMTGEARFDGLLVHDQHAIFADLTEDAVSAACMTLADDEVLRKRIAENALAFSRERADLMNEAKRVSDAMIRLVENGVCAA